MMKAHVAIVCLKCFRGMLQLLYIDVAKVDRNVAHVVMDIHVCSSVCFKCLIYSRRMSQVFYLDVTKVDLDVAKVDLNVAYICMLQLYVSSFFRCSYICL
jgi:hypothetical protein